MWETQDTQGTGGRVRETQDTQGTGGHVWEAQDTQGTGGRVREAQGTRRRIDGEEEPGGRAGRAVPPCQVCRSQEGGKQSRGWWDTHRLVKALESPLPVWSAWQVADGAVGPAVTAASDVRHLGNAWFPPLSGGSLRPEACLPAQQGRRCQEAVWAKQAPVEGGGC